MAARSIFTNAAGMTGGFYTLIDYAGTLNGSFGNIAFGTVPAGFTYSLIQRHGEQNDST